MRVRSLGVLASVALIGVVLGSMDAPAQRAGEPTKPRTTRRGKATRTASPRARTVRGIELKSPIVSYGPRTSALQYDPETPLFAVAVDPELDLDEATLETYQQLANQLSGFATVPNDRLTFYSAFVDSVDYTILGWQGIVENVTADPSGSIVTVAVIPALDSALAYEINYSEQFLVGNDGSIQYLSSTYPAALVGQFPDETDEY